MVMLFTQPALWARMNSCNFALVAFGPLVVEPEHRRDAEAINVATVSNGLEFCPWMRIREWPKTIRLPLVLRLLVLLILIAMRNYPTGHHPSSIYRYGL
ncbi:Uncharacterised protein [Salmonella enterica subsp. arizonae]|uniref:Uncharacterized protein n=1 Tax=Salmonella enterica subsp. arizonae TaxID=59203 RepID=A0A2X4TVC7_SALER|nr:Uncharacterised protein [Salmonella enterica subsp. arizonae]